VLFATPEWARPNNTAKAGDVQIVDPKFIAPDNPEDFARFAGMIAKRYNGANGNGRVVNFIIQNEVNALDWYNPGCGAASHPCDVNQRIESYASIFNLAYDRIKAEQPEARVFFSFDHHFGNDYYNAPRYSSAKQFIETLDPMVSPREWRMAFHSYPGNLYSPEFGPYDYPKVTFGNLGVLAGYLHQRFPTKPHAWDVHLTENGINAASPSSTASQEAQLKVATKNVLGTPGVKNFVYHRLRDHYQEGTFQPGLHDINDNAKPAWAAWANNNRYRQSPQRLTDGYDDLPYVRLYRSVHPEYGHWASTRQTPAGYVAESSYFLLREELPNTTLLYECHVGGINVTRLSASTYCEGDQNFGPVGYVYNFNNSAQTRAQLFSIKVGDGANYLITTDPNEVAGEVTTLGYIDLSKQLTQPVPVRDLSYFDTRYNANNPQQSVINQQAFEQVIGATVDCSDGTVECSLIRFEIGSGQNQTLVCGAGNAGVGVALNYGSSTYGRSVPVALTSASNDGVVLTLPLPIPAEATWGSIMVTSTDGTPTDECVVQQSGGLDFGAAEALQNPNLLYGGDFENAITDWEVCANDATVGLSDDALEGESALEVSNGNCAYQEIAVDAGNTYRMVCHAQHDGPGSGSLRFGFANEAFQSLSATDFAVNENDYKAFSATKTAPTGTVYAVVTYQSGVGAGRMDDCSVEVVE